VGVFSEHSVYTFICNQCRK